jgi:hypothetical protein
MVSASSTKLRSLFLVFGRLERGPVPTVTEVRDLKLPADVQLVVIEVNVAPPQADDLAAS